jgi:hypothetical protein
MVGHADCGHALEEHGHEDHEKHDRVEAEHVGHHRDQGGRVALDLEKLREFGPHVFLQAVTDGRGKP